MSKPTYPQQIVLSVLAKGGYLDVGRLHRYSPRLYANDGYLFALVPRQTLDALCKRRWIEKVKAGNGARYPVNCCITDAGHAALAAADPAASAGTTEAP
jgi:uncharacterized protein YjhX (UPF0386 family)